MAGKDTLARGTDRLALLVEYDEMVTPPTEGDGTAGATFPNTGIGYSHSRAPACQLTPTTSLIMARPDTR